MSDMKDDEGGGGGEPFQEFKLGQDEELRFEVEGTKGQTVGVIVRVFIFCDFTFLGFKKKRLVWV